MGREKGQPVADWRRAALAVVVRPGLWAVAVVEVLALARPRWWRRWPPLPVPPPGYLRFRMVTQYGRPEGPPEAADVVGYLRWCRDMRLARR